MTWAEKKTEPLDHNNSLDHDKGFLHSYSLNLHLNIEEKPLSCNVEKRKEKKLTKDISKSLNQSNQHKHMLFF